MSYQNYVIASFAVFVIVLGWDYVATRLQIRREINNARQRAKREAARTQSDELTR
ncbi:heme exporter protein CcmD [Lysobacter olei]